MNEIDALEEVERQRRLAAHCPDCAGSNLELSAAKRIESKREMAGVCYYHDPLEASSEQLYLQYFSTELNSVYGGVSGNSFGATKKGDAHLGIRTMISKLLSLEKLEFKINEKFDGFEIEGPWDFESQEIYYQDDFGDERKE